MTSASVMPTFHNNLRWRAATDDKFGIITTLGFQCLPDSAANDDTVGIMTSLGFQYQITFTYKQCAAVMAQYLDKIEAPQKIEPSA